MIKLWYPPFTFGDRVEWIRLYNKFLLTKRPGRFILINIENGKKVLRFPPNFNFYPDDKVIYQPHDKFVYISISTHLNLKDIENRDLKMEKKRIYFAKINLETLQLEMLKLLKLKKNSLLNDMLCDYEFCFLIVANDKSKVLVPVNTLTGKTNRNIHLNLLKETKKILISGKQAKCIILDNSIRSDIVNVNKIYCFKKKGSKFSIDKHILNLAKRTNISGYNLNNILFRSIASNKIYMYNLDTDKIYYIGLGEFKLLTFESLYSILPNGIVINKDYKNKRRLFISYLKDNKVHKKIINIPKKERFLGLLNSNEWFVPITIKDKFTRQMCWSHNMVLNTDKYRCPHCYAYISPLINSKPWDNTIKIIVRLYSTHNYKLVDIKEFTLKRTKKLVSTLKPYMLANKIYITSIGRIQGNGKAIINIYPISIVANSN